MFWFDFRYKDNMRKLSKAFRDRPASPLETAIWWIEYVGRGNGLAYIRSDAAEQPWYQRHLLDVIFFLICFSLLVFYVIYRLISYFNKRTKTKIDKRRSKKKDWNNKKKFIEYLFLKCTRYFYITIIYDAWYLYINIYN